MRYVALVPILFLCACAAREPSITRAGPGPSYACILPELSGGGLRQVTQRTREGWRMRVEVLAGPPTGWYDKGHIEYASGSLSYIPNSATLGIAEDRTRDTIHPLLKKCLG